MEIQIVTRSRKASVRRKKASRKRVSGKVRQVPISKLKKALEALQKQIVIKLYGTDCFTCPALNLSGANCQLGHVPWPRSILSTQAKFNYELTRIQCFNCNIRRGGMGAVAYVRLLAQGTDLPTLKEESEQQKGKVVHRAWFEEHIEKYKKLLEGLDKKET